MFSPIFVFSVERIQSRDQVTNRSSEEFIRQKSKYASKGPNGELEIGVPWLLRSLGYLYYFGFPDTLSPPLFLINAELVLTHTWVGSVCTIWLLKLCMCSFLLSCSCWLSASSGGSHSSSISPLPCYLSSSVSTGVAIQDVPTTGSKRVDCKAQLFIAEGPSFF